MCKTCKHGSGADAPAGVDNKFQALIDSPEIKEYSAEERDARTVAISEEHFVTDILPAMQAAADSHVDSRLAAIEKKTTDDA